jgi:hypothetical protein
MEGPDAGVPVVVLPERVDRRVRLGPFPSARDALKFASYAAAGAILAPFLSPFAWVPVLGLGFVVSVWRPDGDAVDERTARILLFHLRPRNGDPLTRRGPSPEVPGSVVPLLGGFRVAVVRSPGTPLAYRPPSELSSLFERFRDLLRATEGPIFLRATTVPIRAAPVLPRATGGGSAETAARVGYGELVAALCRRRSVRRVDVALCAAEAGPEGDRRLTERVQALVEQLAGLGLAAAPLTDRRLLDAVRGFEWTPDRGGS